MAQQMITLEEAAEKLGISAEEMKKRLKTDPDFRRLSQIRDGATVRFKLSAIEELARQLGMASDQDLPMGPVDGTDPGSDDFKVAGPPEKKKPKPVEESPLEFGSSEEDVFSLTEESKPAAPKPKSSGKLTPGKQPKTQKEMSDSSAGSSDSDVRLDGDKPKKAANDESTVPTEELALDFSGPGSAAIKGGSSAKLTPKPQSSGKLSSADINKGKPKPEADSSEFELSLDADSDDFELQMNPDAGDEVDLGSMPKEKSGASSGKRGSKSGINLRDPADSGISLEKSKDKGEKPGKEPKKAADSESDSDVDFELSLDSSAIASSSKLGAPKSGKMVLDSDSDSEFELTLDDSGGSSLEQAALGAAELGESEDKGDIFETDFEIPPMPDESASEAVALESDTDLEKSDFVADDSDVVTEEPSESEVVLLGDEDEAAPAAKTKVRVKKKGDESEESEAAEDEDDGSASKALKGAKAKRRTDDDEEEEEAAAPAGAVVERPTKPWGIVPALFLAPTLLFVLLGAIMAFETLNTMWGYQQPRKPAAPLTRWIASTFDMELRDQ
jgi:hypothetical protein